MAKKSFLTLLILVTLSLGFIMKTNNVSAYKPGYNIDSYVAMTEPVLDGNWTTADEWIDAEERELDGSMVVYFRLKYAWENSTVFQYIIIDSPNDTTDDSNDRVSLCFDSQHDGGTAPKPDDYMISVQGHSIADLHVYQGDGVGWSEIFDYDLGTDLVIVSSLNSSPASSTPHWVTEFKINSTWLGLLNGYWLRVAAYDDSGGAGNQVWPESYSGIPDDWGLTTTKFTNIPEYPHVILILKLLIVLGSITFLVKRRLPHLRIH